MNYSLYQITCGYNVSKDDFKKYLFELLQEYEKEKGIVLTVNSILFGESMYPGEQVAMIFLSINPIRVPEGIGPHVKWLADRLAKIHDQYVVPCSAISPADSVIVGKKDNLKSL